MPQHFHQCRLTVADLKQAKQANINASYSPVLNFALRLHRLWWRQLNQASISRSTEQHELAFSLVACSMAEIAQCSYTTSALIWLKGGTTDRDAICSMSGWLRDVEQRHLGEFHPQESLFYLMLILFWVKAHRFDITRGRRRVPIQKRDTLLNPKEKKVIKMSVTRVEEARADTTD